MKDNDFEKRLKKATNMLCSLTYRNETFDNILNNDNLLHLLKLSSPLLHINCDLCLNCNDSIIIPDSEMLLRFNIAILYLFHSIEANLHYVKELINNRIIIGHLVNTISNFASNSFHNKY